MILDFALSHVLSNARFSTLQAFTNPSYSSADVKEALNTAYFISLVITAFIAGDIPSLLRNAYSRHFNEDMPVYHDAHITYAPEIATSRDSLIIMLSEIPPLKPTAQALLDRARSILTSGPPMSMNIELAEGEELPVALHTLLQGAAWACLMGGGANPDLKDNILKEAREKWPDKANVHDKIRNALTPEAKCLWFLCRKFFFSVNVAELDGKSYQYCWQDRYYHHRMYMGRLFMLDTANNTTITRARMPGALEVYSDRITHIAKTPKGLWGWGDNQHDHLGFKSSGFVNPTRLTFPACPKLAMFEASQPVWKKHQAVKVRLRTSHTLILTPVGAAMAGYYSPRYVGAVADEHLFHPIVVPDKFIPDHVMHEEWTIILTMGDRQLISGDNRNGQLGLGHKREMTGFVDLPFRVDRIMTVGKHFRVFLSGHQLLFVGLVQHHIARSGLLPGSFLGNTITRPTPLCFRAHVKAWYCDWERLCWVTEGLTHCCGAAEFIVTFEATAFTEDGRFCLGDGRWFVLTEIASGEGVVVECERPCRCHYIIPVEVDPSE
ncbi:hypothetical protein J8273_5329 [Carpediemonas membranifera]|uniref:Uncharacterized protein n=1 Tax=Carpediemonas membranifera TaxID=201153 RepID=A0A8J6B3Q8_9EUKA|nr:hypothetical protein J8273_5329 [Carpediemonas membranifera]|eukprot:KAG9392339.1 hypothetical protein J8273_5329 [Carpediemonas membranifera]